MPKIENALNPTTALAFLKLGISNLCLLAGEGQCLKVFDYQSGKLIRAEQIFDSQAIHGIACKALPQHAEDGGTLLIWGGRSISLIFIEADIDDNGKYLVEIRQLMSEILWDDWILDGCFRLSNITDRGPEGTIVEAILVTAHNDLLWLKLVTETVETRGKSWLYRIASGPSSILYSAHMLWADAGRQLLVAAGTVFGEVLLWSFHFDQSATPEVHLPYSFKGHEGSVFGVRISERAQNGAVKRILASCSDDRTIRIWNISDTSGSENVNPLPNGESYKSNAGFLEGTNKGDSTGCLAMIMGHASRIWGLRFVSQEDDDWDLMSYGEDGTAQAWRVSPVQGGGETSLSPYDHSYQLSHQATYGYHSGKNLWAMAVLPKGCKDCIVASGGADGRITIYKPLLHEVPTRTEAWTSKYTMEEVTRPLQTKPYRISPAQAGRADSSTEQIFDSLRGSWKLLRNLDSLLSTYPSGTLEGTAIFAERPPTDDDYNAEYLYSESGDFHTQHGLTMVATRRYVYRYSRTADAISVWFVKPDDGSAVDYFFHKLEFREKGPSTDPSHEFWAASGYHLCVEDNYNANYSFQLRDSKITQWHAAFGVDGPKKDYIAKATYTRGRSEAVEDSVPLNPHLTRVNRQSFGNKALQPNLDFFKAYVWISETEVLTTTDQVHLFVGTLNSNSQVSNEHDLTNVSWEHGGHQTGLNSTCIATSVPSPGVALLTGIDGTIYLYNHPSREIDVIGKLPGKVGFLKAHIFSEPWNRWLRSSHQREVVGVFATCLGSSRATVLIFSRETESTDRSKPKGTQLPSIHECHLALPPKFTVTSSCFVDTENWIISGSRNGDIALYDLTHTAPNSATDVAPKCFPHVHGEDSVTLVENLPRGDSKLSGRIAIMTAGRDGKWAIHHVFHNLERNRLCVDLETIHVGMPPFGPNIEGACIDSTSKDLLLWGFRSRQFVVWNESQKTEVMAVNCGGAHRNWAYEYQRDGSGGGNFVYTKASVCHVHSQMQASHRVIQYGGHGREIKAMAVSPAIKTNDDDTELRFVATGAEDTAIRIFDLNARLKCLSIITKHTTGIQQLRWSPNGHLLFSVAGCEEFFVWRLRPAALVTIGVVCEAQCPTVTEEVSLRIMDFAMEEIHSHHDSDDVAYEPDYLLSKVYSDSSVRIFRYHTSTGKKSFELLASGSYTTYCLTQAAYLHIGETLSALCTASTDGHVAFWLLPNALSRRNDDDDDADSPNKALRSEIQPYPLPWTKSAAIHQNSVKALDHITLSPSETLIVTGGDDGAIAFTRVSIAAVLETATLLIPSAHATAVTGVVLTTGKSDPSPKDAHGRTFTLATVGNDQRLKIWAVSIDTTRDGVEGIEVRRVANGYTSIADASALACYRDGHHRPWLLIAGIGLERCGV